MKPFITPAPVALSPGLCKAIRLSLAWSQEDLALRSGVGVMALSAFESGHRALTEDEERALRMTFQLAGARLPE